ncbi:D-2-hydroxyacid dehydrogenase [Alcaligenes nematophilus]|uniref:D-2-hydroxyacid dehydrogenase n=1 Tax=Alcaligenes nematophilus TaxID=2994643 RepID=A0ABU3MZ67_9BURK|nr:MULTISPECIES: D-2-hydroxyacid dehydrogenase [Alcaligenes]MDT8465064.1 D-2-hydroxyacid dehydrogenase [Alcaligenes nematophilus]MDT8468984.1 D-2-hydroxyacid dehydrogenase [Alcaligenes nematophilus]MDT8506181.1 D-2-hydroxyacid dehydrogenase [Alcaligenes nematophilus]MDT8525895.1 D-2-hydroxyacid dehydrogenase [Alcaligenes nematophilus]QCP80972.1 D-2-hydroxyacid dehydrogenase [Alcaligenes faecalis]
MTSLTRIVFLDRETLSDSVELPQVPFKHELQVYGRTAPDQVAERIADADIVISNKVALRREHLQAAPNLKMIALAATGSDNIDLDAARERGIVVSNIRDYAVRSVPEHVFALIFALRRNICAYRQSVKEGRWQEAQQFCYFDYPIRDLAGSTLGLIGSGSLGQAVATMGRALGMKVIFAQRRGQTIVSNADDRLPFEQVLEQADVLSLHCPLTAETQNMLGMAEFERMAERRPLLINTARGGLIDNQALEHALRQGWLGGAGIDVCTPEPPPADHILMRLLDLPNYILTPHIGWASQEAMQALANQLIENIVAFHRGQARHTL